MGDSWYRILGCVWDSKVSLMNNVRSRLQWVELLHDTDSRLRGCQEVFSPFKLFRMLTFH